MSDNFTYTKPYNPIHKAVEIKLSIGKLVFHESLTK